MRELLQPHAAELVAKAVEMAKAGDTIALRICIDRLIPPMKARDESVRLPALTDSLAHSGRVILQAMADERLTSEEAAHILQALSTQARIGQNAAHRAKRC